MGQRVALIPCEAYDHQQLAHAFDEAIALLGGLAQWIAPGMTVFIKANLVRKRAPEFAATTHPAVLLAVAEAVMALGATPVIGDSPGGPFTARNLKNVYEGCGLLPLEQQGIALNMDTGIKTVYYPDGVRIHQFEVISALLEADAVINVAKLKVHGFVGFTGAVKNLFGIVPGIVKAEYHYRYPKVEDFADMLVDIAQFARPVLSVIDGIVGMEGDGPTAGEPRHIGALIVSPDAHAADWVACNLIGLEGRKVLTLDISQKRNLLDPASIEVLGALTAKMRVDDFKTVDVLGSDIINTLHIPLPNWAKRSVSRLITPRIQIRNERCVGCGECRRCCPADAITLRDNRPIIDRERCIRCFCCQELCPKEAVRIKRPFILKIIK